MADMFRLNMEVEQCIETTESAHEGIKTHDVQLRRETAAVTSSNPTMKLFPDERDVIAKLEYARDIQGRFRKAVEKSEVFMAALQQRFESVNSVTDQKLTEEINTLEACVSEREGNIQPPENSAVCKDTVSLPVFTESFNNLDVNLELLRNKFEIVFRTESIRSGPLTSLTQCREITPGFGPRGITHDPKRQKFVVRTTDVSSPLKLYDYSGELVSEIGQEFPELADSGYYRGLCIDTKRNVVVAASSGRAIVLALDGTYKGEIKVGGNLVAVAYSAELDVYAISDWEENKVYFINPASLEIIKSFGSFGSGDDQFDGPFSLCFGSIDESNQIYLIVGDFNNHCLKLFDIDGRHFKTLGRQGGGSGEVLGPSAVAMDPEGRIVTCDLHNQRLVSLWSDVSGTQWQQLLTAPDLNFRRPSMVSVDTAARMVAIGYAGFDVIDIYKG